MNAVVAGFPEVVADGAEHHGDQPRPIEIAVRAPRLVDHHQRVDPDVAFRVPFRLLLAADQRPHLREYPIDHAEVERQRESE